MQMDRRAFLKIAAAAGAGAALPGDLWGQAPAAPAASMPAAPLAAARRRVQMVRFPEKTDLILLTDRPPQLETPIKYFKTDITSNEAFFVRWHVSGIPTSVDLRTFRLALQGHVDRPLSLSVDDLQNQFEPKHVYAVAQCSGNSRGLFDPRVAGGQWGNGAVGNAKWTGIPLRDLLKRAGVKAGAVDVSFGGLDRPPLPDTPRFVKSLDFKRAMDEHVMVAYAMNDAALPLLNGFPLRLVVPGWYATYWVKSLSEIAVLSEKFKGFWMDKAYRIPNNPQANESPQALATDTVPINRHSVRSLIVTPEAGQRAEIQGRVRIEGVAFDAGEGINRVEVSTDAGQTWADAKLDDQWGKFAWRRFKFDWEPRAVGKATLMSRATNEKGETQSTAQWNRSGYQRNVIEHVDVEVFEGGHL
jgi:sulfite dehydrogenase (cytochrome) subunit A